MIPEQKVRAIFLTAGRCCCTDWLCPMCEKRIGQIMKLIRDDAAARSWDNSVDTASGAFRQEEKDNYEKW